MADPKDIGKAFKEKLKDFNQFPSKTTWKEIESQLPKKEKKTFAYLERIAGIFMILFLLTSSMHTAYKNHNNPTVSPVLIDSSNDTEINNITKNPYNKLKTEAPTFLKPKLNNHSENTDSKKDNPYLSPKKNTKNINLLLRKRFTNHNPNKTNTKKNSQVIFSDTNHKQIEKTPEIDNNPKQNSSNILNNGANLTNSEIDKTNKTQTISIHNSQEKDSIEVKLKTKKDLPITNNKPKDTLLFMKPLKKKLSQKHSISFYIATTYPITPNGSLISDFISKNNNGRISLGYGILLKTHYTEKVALRIGYNRLRISGVTQNIQPEQLRFALNDTRIFLQNDQVIEDTENIDLIQKIFYNEISFGLQYKIIDSKTSMSFIAGSNLLLLDKNRITIKTRSNDFNISGNKNLNKVGFSIHLGANFQYQLTKKMFLNVEPLINYQLKDASKNSKSYRHVYFTLQTGVSYKF